MRCLALLISLSLAGACRAVPPAAPTPRAATEVAASFARTWDAVIDDFAARNIPIRNMERASGFIVTAPLRGSDKIVDGHPNPLADCGSQNGRFWQPTEVTYNVVVRGDSSRATVRSTVHYRWVSPPLETVDCTSRGTWEHEFEGAVKARAEGARGP